MRGHLATSLGLAVLVGVAAVLWGSASDAFALEASGVGLLTAAFVTGACLSARVAARSSGPTEHRVRLCMSDLRVAASFTVGNDLLVGLRTNSGPRPGTTVGPLTRARDDYLFLSWSCDGHTAAARLAEQLNAWQSEGTPLQLSASPGLSTVLMEDARHWIQLPELSA